MKKKIKHEPKRTVCWGIWSISFYEGDFTNPVLGSHSKIREIFFPCDSTGSPINSGLTPPEQERYKKMIKDWVERGILPKQD